MTAMTDKLTEDKRRQTIAHQHTFSRGRRLKSMRPGAEA
jgi:hypothetical protein